MSKTNKNIPELRFPEFVKDGEWNVETIDELCEVLNNIRKPISSDKRENGSYPYYGASGIIDYVNDFLFEEKLLLVGEDGAKWDAYEDTAFLVEGKYWVNNHAHVLKSKNINEKFLESFLIKTDFNPYVTGAAPPKLTLGSLKQIKVPKPNSLKEQQKIASCLSSLDELIIAEEQRLDQLSEHKKGLMQNLFPQEGENVPKVRFKEFEDDWVKTPFSSNILVIDGDRGDNYPKAEEYSSNGYCVFLNAKNVTKNGFAFNEIQFITKEKDKLLRKGKLSRNDIVLTTRGSLGQFAFYDETVPFENVRINSGMVILRLKNNEIDSDFLYNFCRSETIQSTIQAQSFGNAVQQLTVAVINNFTLFHPKSIKEQQKIASCLSSLDELIQAQTGRIEELKEHKKGLMQKLFPNPDSKN